MSPPDTQDLGYWLLDFDCCAVIVSVTFIVTVFSKGLSLF